MVGVGGGCSGRVGCEGRQSVPSGPDKAELKTDECGERDGGGKRTDGAWIYLGRIYCLLCSIIPPPPFFFLYLLLHFCLPKPS